MRVQTPFKPVPNATPRNWQTFLFLGKVVSVNQAAKTVDVTLMNGTGTHYGVPVLCSDISTNSGSAHLPKPYVPDGDEDTTLPKGYERRDVFAIVAFVEGYASLPVVLGFKYPEANQFSFDGGKYPNQRLVRHEGDYYDMMTGDTVDALGGADVQFERDVRYPDNSYFRAYPAGGSKALRDIGADNEHAEQPFRAKREQRKGFFFQHSSGSRVLIGPDGEIKVAHHSGSWISISPTTANEPVAPVTLDTVESATAPQTAADASPVQIHVEHSSGTKFTIKTDGAVDLIGVGAVRIQGTTIDLN